MARDGSEYQLLHAFTHTGPEGLGPYAGLTRSSDGAFYGTTAGGGTANKGTVFRFSISAKP